jgi:hypothetical protein
MISFASVVLGCVWGATATFAELSEVPTLDVLPTDDVWVYPHAGDPAKDPFLRVWGAGTSLPAAGDDEQNFSYSYLRFDLSKIKPAEVEGGISLVLTHVGNPSVTQDLAKDAPIEVRKLSSTFSEKSWSYDQLARIRPEAGKEGLIGAAVPKIVKGELPFEVVIELAKDAESARKILAIAGSSGIFNIALTSGIDPSAGDPRPTYKFYSKDAESAKNRPYLRLKTAE